MGVGGRAELAAYTRGCGLLVCKLSRTVGVIVPQAGHLTLATPELAPAPLGGPSAA